MAFLTGVNLEGKLQEAETRLVPRRKRAPPASKGGCLELMDMPRGPKVEYSGLLQTALKLGQDDELEELRRMIRETRVKMDDQKSVLHGFLSNVRQINMESRNFDSEDIVLYSPSGAGGATGSRAPVKKQLAPSNSAPNLALPGGPADKGKRNVGVKQPAALMPLAGNSDPAASAGAIVPSTTMTASQAAGMANAARPSSASNRAEVLRSGAQPSLAKSRSTPAIAQAMKRVDTKALQLPARRAPPGASSGGATTMMSSAQKRQAAGADSYSKETAELLAAFPALSRTVTDRRK